MTSNIERSTWARACLVAMAAGAALTGCHNSPSGPAAIQRPTPQESFKLIVDDLSRAVRAANPPPIARQSGSSITAVSLNYSVFDELIPPAGDGEPYRGKITVKTVSRVSRVPTVGDDKTKRDQDTDSSDDASGYNSLLDDDSSGNASRGVSTTSDSARRDTRSGTRGTPIMREPDEYVAVYELVYRDNRWDLNTAIDPENEQFMKSLFDHALKTQM